MEVRFPKMIIANNDAYQLFLEYRMNSKKIFVWIVSYVGDHGLYYQDEDIDLEELYKRFSLTKTHRNI
jgi:hypothetical protein